MPSFSYKAADASGLSEEGRIEAKSRAEAFRMLVDRGFRPVSLVKADAPVTSRKKSSAVGGALPNLSNVQLLHFTEELAELLEAGLKLEGALKVIEQRQEKSGAPFIAAHLRRQVRDGAGFSTALKSCGRTFDTLYCNLVAAGEASGALPQILKRQCAYLALIEDLRRRVVSSLLYPAIVFASAIVLMFVFLTFLVPQLSVLLGKTGQQLPVITRALIVVSEFCGAWWWAILASMGVGAFIVRGAVRTPTGRDWWHRVMLELPVVGPVLQAKFFAEMLQTLATLVSNGVALLQALQLMTNATANVYLKALLVRAAGMVGEGTSLAGAFRKVGFFPPVMIDILAIGEQTGHIATSLERAAKRYDRDLTSRIGHLTTLVQPAIILLVAFFVGIIAYSMIAGILTSVSSLKVR